jgi:anti-sigma factor RsiW
MLLGERQTDTMSTEIIDSHLRSLLGSHLTDVASSDQHTVKPWFAGRTDLSPPTVELRSDGFPLVGGRLDLIAGKPVPALVYKRREHVINLFVLPASSADRGESLTRRGYNLRHWDEGDLGFWAVTDAAPGELAEFERLFRAATKG